MKDGLHLSPLADRLSHTLTETNSAHIDGRMGQESELMAAPVYFFFLTTLCLHQVVDVIVTA